MRTLKHKCSWAEYPEDWLDTMGILDVYRQFYNHERANQSLACGNHPPYEAFPTLPVPSSMPDHVDPDAWLPYYARQIFKRRVGQNRTISVGNHDYYVGYTYAAQPVGVSLDAAQHVFHILHKGMVIRQFEI